MKFIPSIFAFLILLSGCSNRIKPDRKLLNASKHYLTEINSICNTENNTIWSFSLNGSMLFADPINHIGYASKKTAGFSKSKDIFYGKLPEDLVPGNKQIELNGEKWNLFTLPLPEDSLERQHLFMLQLFKNNEWHLGLDKVQTPGCDHLNKSENRVWMKIEAEALKDALKTNDVDEQKEHIRMALAAHRIRKVITGKFFVRENNMYLKEGLPELNWLLVNRLSDETNKANLIKELTELQNSDHFSTSFAQVIFPAYGLLMSQSSKDWLRSINNKTNVEEFIQNFYHFEYQEDFLEMMSHLKNTYNGNQFDTEEKARNERDKDSVAKYEKRFLHSPFVMIKINSNTSLDYEVDQLIPFLDKGTIYTGLKATGRWGTVTVNDAALINTQHSYLYLSAPFTLKGLKAKGSDWEMTLNNGYTIIPYKNSDKFIVAKQ